MVRAMIFKCCGGIYKHKDNCHHFNTQSGVVQEIAKDEFTIKLQHQLTQANKRIEVLEFFVNGCSNSHYRIEEISVLATQALEKSKELKG